MNRIFIYLVCTIFFTSCFKDEIVEFEKDYIEVNYQAQKVILKANNDIYGVAFVLSESDSETSNSDINNGVWTCTGDWFSIVLKGTASRRVEVNIQENTSGKDRKVTIVAHRDVGGDTAIITQKAKPTE